MSTNLVPVPSHKGDALNSGFLAKISLAIRHPIKAARYVVRRCFRRATGISDLTNGLGNLPIYVIDIGAAGGWSPRWNRLGENLRIALFEPEPESYEKLSNGLEHDSRAEVFDCALSENGESIDIHVTAWPRASSPYSPSPEYVECNSIKDHYKITTVLSLPSKRLIDIYKNEPDFLKADVEGFELPILKGAGTLIDKIIGMEIEVSFQEVRAGQPLFSDVDVYCREHGFTFMDFTIAGSAERSHFLLPSKRLESKGFLCCTDAIYFRLPANIVKLVNAGMWDASKIYKSVVLYLAYEQHEFAYEILTKAIESNLIEARAPQTQAAMSTIEKCSGFNKSFLHYSLSRI